MSVHDGESQDINAHAAALKLAAVHEGDEIDPQAEKKLLRKIDWTLMPLMCATYALQYYDKAIIGHAAVFGLRTDLDLTQGLRYSNTTLIFYCGFILGSYPLSLLAQKLPTAKVCATICLLWGAIVLTTPACKNYSGFLANRFFLGLIESGVSPAFMLVTGKWYTNEEQVLRTSFWYACSGGINLISPLINYGLGSAQGSIAGWRIMYLFAGALTMLWSVVIWIYFPDSPSTAKRFTEEERAMAILRLRKNNTGFENTQLKPSQALEALTSWHFWAVFLMSMLANTAAGASNTFASLVISGMGFSTFQTLLLNIPLGAMAIITIVGSGYLGRSIPNARHHIYSLACLPVIIGCCLLWKLPTSNTGGRIAGVYLVTFFGSCYLQVIAFGTCNFAGYTKKTVVAAGIFIAYCLGNIIGPLLFDSKFSPRYSQSFTGIMVCFAVAVVISEATWFMLRRENMKRDAEYGAAGISHGLEDLTEKENRDFRYQL
ncbi:major facilitator superfamily domain-containing protein [Xylariales sp. PMI_506]|nr:major facilitator superfamily domain-containing protein [Xylariales sp. PMI_506]